MVRPKKNTNFYIGGKMSLTLHGKQRKYNIHPAALSFAINGLRKSHTLFHNKKDLDYKVRGDVFYGSLSVVSGILDDYISLNETDYFEDDGDPEQYCHHYLGRPRRSNFFM